MITSEVAVAHTQCRLKTYYLLFSDKTGLFHEYVFILKEKSKKNREKYLSGIRMKIPEATTYSSEKMKKGIPILFEANLVFGDLEVYADVLTKVEGLSSQRKYNYTPSLVVGTHKINKEQKLQLAFIGHVLSKFQKVNPTFAIHR